MACPDCFRGGKATGSPKGVAEFLHGYNTYVASPSIAAQANSTVILYTDAFGHLLPNNLLLADALAQETGFTVLVPDIIPGGGMSPDILPLMDTFSSPETGMLGKAWALGKAMVHVIPFFVRASPQSEACTRATLGFARAVRGDVDQGAEGGKLGLAGYCWGGYQALHVAARQHEVRVDAVFVAHPAKFEPVHALDAMEAGVKLSFAHAGQDMALSMAKVEKMKEGLEGGEGFELRVYEGCVHGFAVRATPGKEREADAADKALRQAVGWFGKWL
ncbi:hydrolase [Ascochyta rabiei]|uniref:Hydrolase n=1 Tax=Didymella rabiei TaxID=5454 RepID=A0A162W063_DIDRA|nr:hydrolase [Ascochyta rabiei]